MLKRLSGQFSQSTDQLLLPPPPISPAALISHHSAPSSPHSPFSSSSSAYPFPTTTSTTATSTATSDRPTLHKTLSSLSSLLVSLDEWRQSSIVHSKCQKRLAVALKDFSGCWGDKVGKEFREKEIAEALSSSAGMFEILSEVDSKLAKTIQNEYELINDFASKYFKKTAKEEKTYDETLSNLDHKVTKATNAYQKQASRTNHSASLDSLTSSHSTYVQTLQQLQVQSQEVQRRYMERIGEKREKVGREVGKVLTGLAERSWRNRVEAVRKGGEVVGRVVGSQVWMEAGMEKVRKVGKVLEGRDGGGDGEERGREENRTVDRAREENTPRPNPPAPTTSLTNETAQNVASAGGGGGEDGSGTLRGPRAPSTSTTNTMNTFRTTTTTSSEPTSDRRTSVDRIPPPQTASSPRQWNDPHQPERPSDSSSLSARFNDSSISTSTNSIEVTKRQFDQDPTEQERSNSAIGGGRTLPRGWYLDPSFANYLDESSTEQIDRPRESRRVSYDDAPITIMDGTRDGDQSIRRPTPRYATSPISTSQPRVFDQTDADEFGRQLESGEETSRGGNESFVRKMSERYAGSSGRNENIDELSQRIASPPQSPPSSHARSNSRVSQLAKRYSSPPEPTFTSIVETHPQPHARRPLPPTHRHTTSLQFDHNLPTRPTFTTQTSNSSSSTTYPSSPSASHYRASQSQPHLLLQNHDDPSFSTSSTTSTNSYEPRSYLSDRGQLTREEEEKLQRELRGMKDGKGTFGMKGLVGKGKEVFGRLA